VDRSSTVPTENSMSAKKDEVQEPWRASHSVGRSMIASRAANPENRRGIPFSGLEDRAGVRRQHLSILRRAASQGLRRPVVRSGGAVRRPGKQPQRIPFLAAESLAARASPCPTKDGFSIDDSTRNTHGAPFVTSFHGAHHMIEALATNRSNHSLYIGSLPRRARCRLNLVDTHASRLFLEVMAEDGITVAQQVTPELGKRKGLP